MSFYDKDQLFIERNFTDQEAEELAASSRPTGASLAGKWCAKEAVLKALCSTAETKKVPVRLRGSDAPLKEIEIIKGISGCPIVYLYGEAKNLADSLAIERISVSISYSQNQVIAQALAF